MSGKYDLDRDLAVRGLEEFKVSREDAFRLLDNKLEENKATAEDIFALCYLLPSLLPLVRAKTTKEE